MKKLLLIAFMMVAAVLVLAACGENKSDNTNTGAGAGVEETGTAASTKITIKAKRYEFEKPVYTIKKGEPTEITLKSEDGIHGIEVSDLNGLKIDSDKPKVVTINEPGEYEFHCDIMCGSGHSKMIAKLVVE
ncbi:cupredoxin domain-containing protein [Paenibacillus sp. OV219]|uniref:cupredoxin domain-containing protein n=1 Tax=Paenibacillus sp. OV219 TaxID=1884377 RepID=UPI0008BC33F0|nr:cupredoxin domain-containing protein [Paenibacillus sp. OV219]SEN78260.1 cytochrome c oxidase subunit 2 [Paenibacillus sp. OV219]